VGKDKVGSRQKAVGKKKKQAVGKKQ